MSIGAILSTFMCTNMVIQNNIKIQREKDEKEEEERIKAISQSSFNKEKRGDR